ncbi:MAG TPA: hypothetical protein PK526_03100 [bacterium]|nr:hypothetical protein [bacterium]
MIKNDTKNKVSAALLNESYSRIIDIFEAIKSGLILYTDENLNQCYISLVKSINKILEESCYSELKTFVPDFYKDITSKINFIDREWDQYKEELYNFSSKINSYCLTIGAKKEVLSIDLWSPLFNQIDEAITNHRETVKYFSEKLLEKQNNNTEKIKINISDNRGIWRKDNKTIRIYEIGINTKRFMIIKCLKNKQKSGPALAKSYANNSLSQLSKEIKKINSLFKEKLLLNENLIEKANTGGYELNITFFDINFE